MPATYRSTALDLDTLRSEVELLDPTVAVAVAVLDLDGFQQANDRLGPTEGDALLARVESHLRDAVGDGELVAHVRGDEFAVALVDATPELLLIALEGVRRDVERHEEVRLSGGIAGRPQHGASVEELLAAADTALVRSKREGGNRLSISSGERMVLKSSYYAPSALHHLAKLARLSGRPEASLLREALDDLLAKRRAERDVATAPSTAAG
jgi:diguanylate cyclase (GGDEF)-like protein